jgi:alpha-L-fucosidase
MWCDIGGPNVTIDFATAYFNDMAQQGKQVLLNNRCGVPGDFDTPEYARYDAVQIRKWESNLGMDPFSYGYNRATPDDAYLKPAGVVTSLMDIISKNGNFLLDVGPTANGTIIAVEQENLRAAGQWIKSHAEAIFNTVSNRLQALHANQTSDVFNLDILVRHTRRRRGDTFHSDPIRLLHHRVGRAQFDYRTQQSSPIRSW